MPGGFCSGHGKVARYVKSTATEPLLRCRNCIKNSIPAKHYLNPSIVPKSAPIVEKTDDNPLHPNSRVEQYDRYRAVIYSEFGYNQSEIAMLLGIDRRTVARIHLQFATTGNVDDKLRSGRKRKLTEEQETNIVQYAKKVYTYTNIQNNKLLNMYNVLLIVG
jgi:hypothetical protein